MGESQRAGNTGVRGEEEPVHNRAADTGRVGIGPEPAAPEGSFQL